MRTRARRKRSTPWFVAFAALSLTGCTVDPGPLVGPGTLVVSDPAVQWVARIAWSDDGDELAFLGTAPQAPMLAYRAALGDATLRGAEVGDFADASEIRYVPGGRDLVVAGRPSTLPDPACDDDGVVLVRGARSAAIVGCPFERPLGLLGRAGIAHVDVDQFVAAATNGTALAAPTANGARWVDLSTFATRDLGPGFPLAFDPSGARLVVLEFDPAVWARHRWWIVDVADGTRSQLPIDEDRFARGYHVLGVRWLDEGLVLLIERDDDDGSEWLVWNLDTGVERVLGPARADAGAFPLGTVPRWSASGRRLAFREYVCLRASLVYGCADERWSIVVVDVATGERRLAYRGPEFVDVPTLAPDDGAVAFALGGSIYVKTLP